MAGTLPACSLAQATSWHRKWFLKQIFLGQWSMLAKPIKASSSLLESFSQIEQTQNLENQVCYALCEPSSRTATTADVRGKIRAISFVDVQQM